MSVRTISLNDLQKHLTQKDAQLVNVLDATSYAAGFIKGSLNFPIGDLDARAHELDTHREVIVYCAGTPCTASLEAAEKLAIKGFDVAVYEGGLKEWGRANLPLETAMETMDQPSGLSGLGSEAFSSSSSSGR